MTLVRFNVRSLEKAAMLTHRLEATRSAGCRGWHHPPRRRRRRRARCCRRSAASRGHILAANSHRDFSEPKTRGYLSHHEVQAELCWSRATSGQKALEIGFGLRRLPRRPEGGSRPWPLSAQTGKLDQRRSRSVDDRQFHRPPNAVCGVPSLRLARRVAGTTMGFISARLPCLDSPC